MYFAEESQADTSQDEGQDSHYLHPSLQSASAKPVGANEFIRFRPNELLIFVVLPILQVTLGNVYRARERLF